MLSRIVTHCLAVWNQYSSSLSQTDKDYFDDHVAQALEQTGDEFAATHLLVQRRLEQEGYTADEAVAIAQRLVNQHVQQFAQSMIEPVQLSTTSA